MTAPSAERQRTRRRFSWQLSCTSYQLKAIEGSVPVPLLTPATADAHQPNSKMTCLSSTRLLFLSFVSLAPRFSSLFLFCLL